MIRSSMRCIASLTVLALAAPAAAQTPVPPPPPPITADTSPNTLWLRDRTVVQGTILELRAGQFVTISTPAGVRTIAWVDIMRAEGPSFPGRYESTVYAPASGGAAIVAPDSYDHPEPDRAPLVIRSLGPTQEISEFYSFGGGGSWGDYGPRGRSLCMTPCTLYVPPRFFILARGSGVRPTAIDLRIPPSGLEIDLRAPSIGRFYGSLALMITGGLGVLVGGLTLLFGAVVPTSSTSAQLELIGGVTTGVSAALLVTGIVLLATDPPGIGSSRPLHSPPLTPRLGFAPTPNGAFAALTFRF